MWSYPTCGHNIKEHLHQTLLFMFLLLKIRDTAASSDFVQTFSERIYQTLAAHAVIILPPISARLYGGCAQTVSPVTAD